MIDTTNVKEVQKTRDEKEVNRLLSEGWKLVSIIPYGYSFQYLLVKE